jgi:UDP-2,3-diacylglucosamine hydrolase
LHPNFGIGLASFFSSKSRKSQDNEYIFKGAENEWLYQYSKEVQLKNPYDYYIFGHRHLPLSMPLDNAVYYNLGEWLTFNTFIKMESGSPSFLRWNGKHPEPFEPQPHGAI